MTWVKLTDTFAEDARLHAAGPEAFTLHIAGLCYSSRRTTDGFIPATMVRILWPLEDVMAAVGALIANGLWVEREGGGYEIVDYLADQPSAEEVKKRQAQAKARYESWKSRHGKPPTHSQRGDNAVANASPSRPAPEDTKGRRDGRPAAAGAASGRRPKGRRPTGQRPTIDFEFTIEGDS